MVNFAMWIPDCDSHIPAVLDLFLSYDYSHTDWDGLRDHLRDVPWEDIFKLGASAAPSEFCKWVQVGIDVYIPQKISGQA